MIVTIAALVPTVGGAVTKPLHEDVTEESIIDFELAGSSTGPRRPSTRGGPRT